MDHPIGSGAHGFGFVMTAIIFIALIVIAIFWGRIYYMRRSASRRRRRRAEKQINADTSTADDENPDVVPTIGM